ncbi:NUDIX domain-containing protein [Actinacidiphila oryziradicis]|uniref:NUDIX hydrolase n=1 Tax=Actinacidiphila oryziradicis TaxID=2571141 RepID=UPI0023F2FAD2|nr:NUDIX domain-containing protein [Actinacidiphila oryziradicis]MCW2874991.1 mismatch repair protein MutT [Actinacidiphila oryziradicis]
MNPPVDTALLDDLLRSADADRITKHVVGAVITDEDGRVLLLHRTADDYFGDLWELPSGGVDDGETLPEALHREVEEETGLTVTTVSAYLGHFDYLSQSGKLTRQFNFTATTTDGAVKLTEHDDHLWADRAGQEKVSSAVRTILATWRGQAT